MHEPKTTSGRPSPTGQAAMLGVIYFVAGGLWIWLSDGFVHSLAPDAQWLAVAQRYKGLAYVCVTAVGLAYLAYLGHRRLLAMQERVHNSDLRVADLFMNHPQPMFVFDASSGRVLRVNRAAVARFGHSEAEFLRLSARDLMARDEAAQFVAFLGSDMCLSSATRLARYRARSGEVLQVRLTPSRIEVDGRPAALVMAEDVTNEARLEDAMAQQQRHFKELLQGLGEVLWIATPDASRVTYVSPAFETIYGRRPEDLLANPKLWQQVVHPDDASQAMDIRRMPAGVDSVQSEYRIVRPDGELRWVRDRKLVVRDDRGAVALVGGVAEDISAQKERDEARAALHGQLEALVAERTQELAQANIELEAFSRTAAHDLKTPLNGIVGMSSLLRGRLDGRLDDASRRYLDQIQRSAGDMARLINDLLAFSRVGSVELQRRSVDVAPAVRRLVDELRALEPLRQVQLAVPERLELVCDEGLMRSVLQNLVTNAWKFTAGRDEAHIQVAAASGATETVLTVSDNGAGFDTSAVGPALRPFQRFHTQAQFQGTGLGLVTCQRIAQRHGGRLVLESTPGVGTKVSVVLPRVPPLPSTPAPALPVAA